MITWSPSILVRISPNNRFRSLIFQSALLLVIPFTEAVAQTDSSLHTSITASTYLPESIRGTSLYLSAKYRAGAVSEQSTAMTFPVTLSSEAARLKHLISSTLLPALSTSTFISGTYSSPLKKSIVAAPSGLIPSLFSTFATVMNNILTSIIKDIFSVYSTSYSNF